MFSLCAAGNLNGFGHIQFDTEEAVQRALALHGADLMGRELYVAAAVNKPPDAGGASGKPVEGCWFCLSNPNADVNLIASVGGCRHIVSPTLQLTSGVSRHHIAPVGVRRQVIQDDAISFPVCCWVAMHLDVVFSDRTRSSVCSACVRRYM